MKRVALYLRVSTEEQARIQDGSLVSQRKRLEEYVENQNRREAGWGRVVGIYCDEGRSAKDMKRPEFQRLLTDVRAGKVSLILATELSRMSRSIRDFCELWDLFKKHGASFITLREQFDTTTAAGEMMVFNLINFAQFERKQTAERISANFKSRAERGLWNGGTIPHGFDRNPKNPGELLPSPKEAEQVRKIFELFLKIGSVRKTCLELPRQGIYSKRYTNKHGIEKGGHAITCSGLQQILTNQAYLGMREIGKKRNRDGKHQVVKASWPALVTLDLFNEAQDRLMKNRYRCKPVEVKTYPFPLTEIVVCGECGRHLGGKSSDGRNGRHFYYGHSRSLKSDALAHLKRCQLERVRAPRIEEMVLRSLKKLAQDPKLVDQWLEIHARRTQAELPGMNGRLKQLEIELQTQRKREENLTLRLADLPQDIAAEPIYRQLRATTARIKELESAHEDLTTQQRTLAAQSIDRERLLFRIRRAVANLEKAPVEDQRGVIVNLIQFAEVHPNRLRLGVFSPLAQATGNSGGGHTSALPAKGTDSDLYVEGSTNFCNGE